MRTHRAAKWSSPSWLIRETKRDSARRYIPVQHESSKDEKDVKISEKHWGHPINIVPILMTVRSTEQLQWLIAAAKVVMTVMTVVIRYCM